MAERPDIQIDLEQDPSGTLAALIDNRLTEALRQNVPPNDSEPLLLLAREGTEVVARLLGATSYGWLLVKMLWVKQDLHRHGLGARLMTRAEALARQKGCHGAWLDTSSRDAERFYARLGYKPFATLENREGERPPGHRRVFLAKRFASGP